MAGAARMPARWGPAIAAFIVHGGDADWRRRVIETVAAQRDALHGL